MPRYIDKKNFLKVSDIKGDNNSFVNFAFHASSGLKINLMVEKTCTVADLLKRYVRSIGLHEKLLGDKLVFLYDAKKVNIHSQKTAGEFFPNFCVITVVDNNNLIGA